ncbi:hypothetical protein CFII64_29119 [Pseudomonas sp. CFII64]|uniref:PepSY-associated TM helix domain-containing protein n=1 Tax=Pseudomonas sp. CFII64 TaxID=911242 RepID=UPI00035752D8|nr:PepSY-associated TM helix domain-containing protein [Pseudomonas sp. CFII64]EPJ75513.1 hypothetical protein CFII64_29119 [Pseudomonas sp. CFII64]
MREGFRQTMAWLHTWIGLVFGWLLFAIFLTGTMSYFKTEITRWTQPEIPVRALNSQASAELAQAYLQQNAMGASRWFINLPDERDPKLGVMWQVPSQPGQRGTFVQKNLDAQTGTEVQARDSRGGEFFYRFHFQLQMPHPWGRWLATAAAMLMFITLISGIITHKKIFKEFFTFRPRKGQRSWLDGHNAIGVLALPFHLMITYSSLVIFMSMVMPASIVASYGNDTQAFFADLFPANANVKPAGTPAPLASLPDILKLADQQAPGGHIGRLTVNNPGDANATVVLFPSGVDSIVHDPGAGLTFNGVTGALQSAAVERSVPLLISGGFYGLHLGHFAGPLLRWMYFIFGIASTAMIGTGLVMWLKKRRVKHEKTGVLPFELRLVEVLNIAGMGGLMIAVASFFWTNRLLPVSFPGRGGWEINMFFIAWGLTLLHAALRSGRNAWREQLALGALLYAGLPLLDIVTSGRYLLDSLAHGDWVLLGFDLTALATGLFLAWAARKFRPVAPLLVADETAPPLKHRERQSVDATQLEGEAR